MDFLTVAEVSLDGQPLKNFTDVFLTQRFNQHHEFSIRVNHDELETSGSFKIDHTKDLIGKGVLINLVQTFGITRHTAYSFSGLICEVGMIQSQNGNADLLIKGYSPTILLEDGPRFTSFNEKSLSDIVTKTMKPVKDFAFFVNVNPDRSEPIKYVCQYKESSFHFLNRLSSDYGESFYYDGSTVIFGHPETLEFVETIFGADMTNMQLNMHVEPIEANKFAYTSKKNEKLVSHGAPLTGLGEFPQRVVDASNTLFPNPDDLPLMQRVETQREADAFVNKSKKSIAAGLVVLTATTNNPNLFLGCIADIKVSKNSGAILEDFGVYKVISITHHITGNAQYFNTFEGLAGSVENSLPVYNATMPVAEPQTGIVVNNVDPDKLGRVKVQMLWQSGNEETDWIWVIAPDGGAGKGGAGGGGFTFVPEKGDRVLIGFMYNNPDRPFVMGSMFHGKTAVAGQSRCITGRKSSAKVCIDDAAGAVNIFDGKNNNIVLDGDGHITIQSTTEIYLGCNNGASAIQLLSDGTVQISGDRITINGSEVEITGTTKAIMKKDDGTGFKAEGSKVTMHAATAEVRGVTEAKLNGAQVKIKGDSKTEVKGGILDMNVT